jgi:hypothetical protein
MKRPVIISGPSLPPAFLPSLYPFLILPLLLLSLVSTRPMRRLGTDSFRFCNKICRESGSIRYVLSVCVIVVMDKKEPLHRSRRELEGVVGSGYHLTPLSLCYFFSLSSTSLFLFLSVSLFHALPPLLTLPTWPRVPLLRSEWLNYSCFGYRATSTMNGTAGSSVLFSVDPTRGYESI